MARRDIDTCDASKRAHRIRQLRRRTQRLEHICLDPVRSKAQSRFICEFRRHTAGIIRDRHTLLLPVLADDIIRKPLGCLPYRIDIHAVRPCADNPSKPGRTEFKVLIKTLFDLVVILCNTSQFFLRSLVKVRVVQPFFIFLTIFHFSTSCP